MIGDAEESAMLLGTAVRPLRTCPPAVKTATALRPTPTRSTPKAARQHDRDRRELAGRRRQRAHGIYAPLRSPNRFETGLHPYLTKQEVVDEGTLPYTFLEDNPDEKWYGVNAYTSYAKIRGTMSDERPAKKPNIGRSTSIPRLRKVLY